MKLIRLAVVLCFCSSVVLAETTLEIIQKRAEAGDATAQTLMGLMAFYGYQVPKDSEASREWYQRAADQGDSFAAGRIERVKKQSEKKSPLSLREVLEKKVADASSAEYKGTATFEDLALKRTEYIGKVVKLKFDISFIYTSSEPPYLFVRSDQIMTNHRLMLCDQKALEWGMKTSKSQSGSNSGVYVLVDEEVLIALGVNKQIIDDGCVYSW